jgi:ribosomal protein L2
VVAQAAALHSLLARGHVWSVFLPEQRASSMQPAAHLLGGYAHRRAELGIAQTFQLSPQQEAARTGGHTGRCRPHLLAQVSPLYPGSGLGLDLVA